MFSATDRSDVGSELGAVLARGGLRALFQPIVLLETRETIAYEALSRGPAGSRLENPDALFSAARVSHRLVELDSACRSTVLRTAKDAGFDVACGLFVNVEPEAIGVLATEIARGATPTVIEITERALTGDPAQLLRSIAEIREHGCYIALDDVGAHPASLALLPLIAPDVIKLDMRMVRDRPDQHAARILNAVSAHSEATGAAILAEGIETEEQLVTAKAMGATLGQGWLFGRPEPLPTVVSAVRGVNLSIPTAPEPPEWSTPFLVATAHKPPRPTGRDLLFELTRFLELRGASDGESTVVISTFQTAESFTPYRSRYRELARSVSLVAALSPDVETQREPEGLQLIGLEADDPLVDEWSIVVLAPDFSALLAARDSEEGDGLDFVLTHDRNVALEAARTLLQRL